MPNRSVACPLNAKSIEPVEQSAYKSDAHSHSNTPHFIATINMNHRLTFKYLLITLYCASLTQQQSTPCMNQCVQNCLQNKIQQCHQNCQQSCDQSTDLQTVSGSLIPQGAFLPLGGAGPALTSSLSPSPSLSYGPISAVNRPIYLMPGKPYNSNIRISGNTNVPSSQRYPQGEMISGSNIMRNSICVEVCMPSCTTQCIASSPIVPAVNERPGAIIMGGPGPVIPRGIFPLQGGPGPVIPQETLPFQGEPGVIPTQSSTGGPSFIPYRQSGPMPEFVPSLIPNQPHITQCIPSKTHFRCICPKNYIVCSNNNDFNQCCRK